MATRSATKKGCWRLTSITANPSRIRLVRWLTAAEQHVGTRAVADLLEEVHLGQPEVLEAGASAASAWSSMLR